ncbi:hypothetical protein ACYFX5_01520 [Bremerella sp. T1]|uniref:hypothetical protein n=1 Tax=Bremerella sp. TYQ1 TaxID=3119568 RepID=UPI001CCF6F1B|nr:hypothetical protein [Bremerella volcania]UBM36963.1 hypothetical protein LA756_03480 [Bremerella volcania]
MDVLKQIVTSVDFWKLFAPACLAILAWLLNEKSKRSEDRWKMKREACIQALNIANGVLSNYQYANVPEGDIVKEQVDTIQARRCMDTLACTCKSPDVLATFKRILFGEVSPDSILDLRNAVRKELGFGRKAIDTDREKAFIGKLGADRGKSL